MKIKDRAEYRAKPMPLTCPPSETVLAAVRKMAEANYGSIVVTHPDGTVAGMVTERDIFKRLVAEERDPAQTRVADIMTSDVRMAREDDSLLDWLRIMSNERFRRLPVVDDSGKLVSIMTQGDFVSYTWPELVNQATTLVKSTMGKNYQVFLILAAVLAYTVVVAAVFNVAL